ncbi:hypothetical protein AB670_03274 [Chryseobacterium sp. MOF25P]|nr:hypothetical protein AB670_03274 [Chryseobacterium sp. MOF25P]
MTWYNLQKFLKCFLELFPAFHCNLFFQKRIFIAIGAKVFVANFSNTLFFIYRVFLYYNLKE